jgi:RNA ligase
MGSPVSIRYNTHRDPDYQKKLDSLTKYPSIPTYHKMTTGGKGHLTEALTSTFDGPVHITEKVDGTNGRILYLPDDMYFVGSRTEWLTARGDTVYNPKENIVDRLGYIAECIGDKLAKDRITVVYTEVYGGGIGAHWRNYTSDPDHRSFAAFDVMIMTLDEFDAIMRRPVEDIAAWRKAGSQPFLSVDALNTWTQAYLPNKTVPHLATIDAGDLPVTLTDTEAWLHKIAPESKATYNESAKKLAEGVVLRSEDRSVIAKVRFEDYARTARVLEQRAGREARSERLHKPKPLARRLPG